MNYIASITSQGQLTIPKPLRDKYGIKKTARAFITDLGNKKFEVKTYTDADFWALEGILKDTPVAKKNRGKPLQQIIDEENEAIQQAIANNVADEMGLPPLK